MEFTDIQRVLADQLGLDEEQIKPESTLADDLGADSLDLVEIVMAFEEEYDIEITDADAEACKTVADIEALLKRCIPEKAQD